MRKKIIKDILQMLVFAVLLYVALCIFTGCSSTRTHVSDIGIGAGEYRRIQTEQREGEVDLAVTGAKLEHESREIRAELGELEQSIVASRGAEQEIGNIIQRVREGETELAVTSAELEHEGREIRTELGELERSIIASKGTEQAIRDILQRIRTREVDPAFIEEWRNRRTKERSGG